MIIEVGIGEDDAPRRYRVARDGGRLRISRMAAGARPGASPATMRAVGLDGDADGEDGDATGGNSGASPGETVIDWRRPEPQIYSLLVEGHSYEVFIDDEGDELTVHLLNRTFQARAIDARALRAARGPAAVDGAARITAPIPGRVARILMEVGSDVKRGEGVIVLEAMKMENELRAPRDGTVTAVEVEEGQGVDGGTLLAIIE